MTNTNGVGGRPLCILRFQRRSLTCPPATVWPDPEHLEQPYHELLISHQHLWPSFGSVASHHGTCNQIEDEPSSTNVILGLAESSQDTDLYFSWTYQTLPHRSRERKPQETERLHRK